MQAEIYTKTNCPYCFKAKDLFDNQNVSYVEYIIGAREGGSILGNNQQYVSREQLLERAPQAKTVPQIWLEGNYIGGYTELAAFFAKKQG